MKLLTSTIKKAFVQKGCQEDVSDPVVLAKFFDPCSQWTWYATEFDPETEIFYGFVIGFEGEWGSFSLAELEQFRGKLGLPIERDFHFEAKPFSEISEISSRFK